MNKSVRYQTLGVGRTGTGRAVKVGVSAVDSDTAEWSGDDTVFAWQVGAGVGYAINERTTV